MTFVSEFVQNVQSSDSVSCSAIPTHVVQLCLLKLFEQMVVPDTKSVVLVCASEKELFKWSQFLGANSQLYGRWRVLEFVDYWRFPDISTVESFKKFINGLHWFYNNPGNIILTTPLCLHLRGVPDGYYEDFSIELAVGDSIDLAELTQKLLSWGYVDKAFVENPGEFSVRGGVFDLFPADAKHPFRFQTLGDEVEQIGVIRSHSETDYSLRRGVQFYPASLIVSAQRQQEEFIQNSYEFLKDHFGAGEEVNRIMSHLQEGRDFSLSPALSHIFWGRPAKSLSERSDIKVVFLDSLDKAMKTVSDWKDTVLEPSLSNPTLDLLHKTVLQIFPLKADYSYLDFKQFSERSTETSFQEVIIDDFPDADIKNPLESWMSFIKKNGQSYRYHFYCMDLPDKKYLGNALGTDSVLSSCDVTIEVGYIEKSFLSDDHKTIYVAPFKSLPKGRKIRRRLRSALSSFHDLSVGDLLVHRDNGICRYGGLKTITVGGLTSDCLLLEFHGTDRIFLPVYRLDAVSSYEYAGDHSEIKLDKLGGSSWQARKSRVSQEVRELAEKLILAQAQREVRRSEVFRISDEQRLSVDESFPYIETDCQLTAIQEIRDDLASTRLMDRLLIGDVGFGKTEVAVRAILEVVLSGGQVCFFAPTTVLCNQHMRNLSQRLGEFGVLVDVLDRSVSDAQLTAMRQRFDSRRLDVLIGTHRLVNSKVSGTNIGLVIVDEEQKFGVAIKERMKSMAQSANILSMSATPIPRTLNFSLLGLRSVSSLTEAPSGRRPIRNAIAEFSETRLIDSVKFEIQRGGQVYVVVHQIKKIAKIKRLLATEFGQESVAEVHGRMTEDKVEDVLAKFINRQHSILVSTSIIESGVDIASVSTIVVCFAENFGLGQLYQLRGRVGRSNTQSYAWFLYQSQQSLTDSAKKRLEVLEQNQELGAGFRIAKRDLEIRGIGNLLGKEQSGEMAIIGVELYMELLGEAVREARGQPKGLADDIELNLGVSALIPKHFIEFERERLSVYRELFTAKSLAEVEDLENTIRDRYGAFPMQLSSLLSLAKCRVLLIDSGVRRASYKKGQGFILGFGPLKERQVAALLKKSSDNSWLLTKDFRLLIPAELKKEEIMNRFQKLVEDLSSGMSAQ